MTPPSRNEHKTKKIMATIKIGADELILWLRKNGKATDIPNDEVQGLGRKIYDLIVIKLGGKKYKTVNLLIGQTLLERGRYSSCRVF